MQSFSRCRWYIPFIPTDFQSKDPYINHQLEKIPILRLCDTMDSSALTRLAPELRNHIYELVLTVSNGIELQIGDNESGPRIPPEHRLRNFLAVTTTCKQIRREAMPFLLRENELRVTFPHIDQLRFLPDHFMLRIPDLRNPESYNVRRAYLNMLAELKGYSSAWKLMRWMESVSPRQTLPKAVRMYTPEGICDTTLLCARQMRKQLRRIGIHLSLDVRHHHQWPFPYRDAEGSIIGTKWSLEGFMVDFSYPVRIRDAFESQRKRLHDMSDEAFVRATDASGLGIWDLVDVRDGLQALHLLLKQEGFLQWDWDALDNTPPHHRR